MGSITTGFHWLKDHALEMLETPSMREPLKMVSGVHRAHARWHQCPQVVRFITPPCTGHSAHAGSRAAPAASTCTAVLAQAHACR